MDANVIYNIVMYGSLLILFFILLFWVDRLDEEVKELKRKHK